MRRLIPILALIACSSLAAACSEEPSVAEQFNTLSAEVENKGRQYEAEAENLVAAEERDRMNEAEALLRETANQLGPANTLVDTGGNRLD